MPTLETIAAEELIKITAANRRRVLPQHESGLISFASNDYLGLSEHPEVKEAAHEAIRHYGTGAGASRLVTGNHPLYAALETQLAAWKGTEAALVFGSGYLTNIGVIPALVGRGDLILADRLIHACLLDGAQLSGAKLIRFAHNDMAACESLLQKHRADYRHTLILTDTIFSMDGDHAPLEKLSTLAKAYDSWLLTDDAHVTSASGKPLADIHMGTLSKALGSYGGYICASKTICDYLLNTARSVIFSTGLPPATIAAAHKALEITMRAPDLTAKPLKNARYFTSLLGINEATSQIVPLILGEEEKALNAATALKEHGFLVAAIRPPTVPQGTARLRVAFSATHRLEDIERLAKTLT